MLEFYNLMFDITHLHIDYYTTCKGSLIWLSTTISLVTFRYMNTLKGKMLYLLQILEELFTIKAAIYNFHYFHPLATQLSICPTYCAVPGFW